MKELRELREKYLPLLTELNTTVAWMEMSKEKPRLTEGMRGAVRAIDELLRQLAEEKRVSAALSCRLVQISEERDHLNAAVARIAKERDEAVAEIARLNKENLGQRDLIARLEEHLRKEATGNAETEVCGDAGGA